MIDEKEEKERRARLRKGPGKYRTMRSDDVAERYTLILERDRKTFEDIKASWIKGLCEAPDVIERLIKLKHEIRLHMEACFQYKAVMQMMRIWGDLEALEDALDWTLNEIAIQRSMDE
ncbi:MAG: hypothetical protein WCE81_05130 [Halobacteriota archaeon]